MFKVESGYVCDGDHKTIAKAIKDRVSLISRKRAQRQQVYLQDMCCVDNICFTKMLSLSLGRFFFLINALFLKQLIHLMLHVLKVREDQEKRRIEEEKAQQIGQQSATEVPQQISQPASYVSPQPTQYSTQMPAQPASQQSIQSPNYSTAQPTQNTTMVQAMPAATHSSGQVPAPLQSQSVASVLPEPDEPENDQHQHPQQAGGGIYGSRCIT